MNTKLSIKRSREVCEYVANKKNREVCEYVVNKKKSGSL